MIIFLFGEDSFRSRKKLDDYRQRYLLKYGSSGSFEVYDAEDGRDFDLTTALKSSGLFAPVRLIIAKNFISSLPPEKIKNLASFLKSSGSILKEKEIVLIYWEKEVPKKNNALFRFLNKYAKTERFETLKGIKLTNWIDKRLLEINNGTRISRPAIERLVINTGGNIEQINNELFKLSAFKNQGGISEEDVRSLVFSQLHFSIFETIKAASSGKKYEALRLMHKSLGSTLDPFYLLAMYAYQFRNLLKIKWCVLSGAISGFEVAKKAGVHPYAAQEGLRHARSFTLAKLRDLYFEIKKIDLKSKTEKVDIVLELDKFIIKI